MENTNLSNLKKKKEARKKQKTFEIKEIGITPNIDKHDFDFKSKNAKNS